MKEIIFTSDAPAAIGPYSQGTQHDGIIFVSGQLPIVPATGKLCTGSIGEQTKQAMENICAILKEAGSDISKVLKTTILLADLADFAEVNAAYGEYFKVDPPARACYQVAALPKNARIEIEAICAK